MKRPRSSRSTGTPAYNVKFGYYGLKNVYENLLLRHPETGKVIETPQHYLMRRSVKRSKTATEAIKTYHKLGQQDASSPEVVAALAQDVVTVTNAAMEENIPFRPLMAGMGQAVAERTILRKDATGKWENWGDVARRVALGNTMLASTESYPFESEFRKLRRHIANGNTLMSGRHLQHDDAGHAILMRRRLQDASRSPQRSDGTTGRAHGAGWCHRARRLASWSRVYSWFSSQDEDTTTRIEQAACRSLADSGSPELTC